MKLGKFSTILTLALGLCMLLSLAPLTTGAFAQSAHPGVTKGATHAVATMTHHRTGKVAKTQQPDSASRRAEQAYRCFSYYRYGRFFTRCYGGYYGWRYGRYYPRYYHGYYHPRYYHRYYPGYHFGYYHRYYRYGGY